MERIIIRIHIPKTDLETALKLKQAIDRLVEDIEGVEVELSSYTVRE